MVCKLGKTKIAAMRILLVGAGGVGTAFARIAARRPFAELVVADYDLARAQQAAAAKDGYLAVRLDAPTSRPPPRCLPSTPVTC